MIFEWSLACKIDVGGSKTGRGKHIVLASLITVFVGIGSCLEVITGKLGLEGIVLFDVGDANHFSASLRVLDFLSLVIDDVDTKFLYGVEK